MLSGDLLISLSKFDLLEIHFSILKTITTTSADLVWQFLKIATKLIGYCCTSNNQYPRYKKKLPKRYFKEAVNGRRENTMVKRERIYKTLHRKLKIEQHEPHIKNGRKSRCSGRWCSSCSTSSTHRVTVKPHEQLMICKFYKQKIKKGARTGLIVTNKKIVNWKCRPLLPSNEPPLVGNFLHTVKRTWHYLDKRHEKHSVLS